MSWHPESGRVPPSAERSFREEWLVALAVCVMLVCVAIGGLFAVGAL